MMWITNYKTYKIGRRSRKINKNGSKKKKKRYSSSMREKQRENILINMMIQTQNRKYMKITLIDILLKLILLITGNRKKKIISKVSTINKFILR